MGERRRQKLHDVIYRQPLRHFATLTYLLQQHRIVNYSTLLWLIYRRNRLRFTWKCANNCIIFNAFDENTFPRLPIFRIIATYKRNLALSWEVSSKSDLFWEHKQSKLNPNLKQSTTMSHDEKMTEAKLRHLQKEEERKQAREKERQMEENVLQWIELVVHKRPDRDYESFIRDAVILSQ